MYSDVLTTDDEEDEDDENDSEGDGEKKGGSSRRRRGEDEESIDGIYLGKKPSQWPKPGDAPQDQNKEGGKDPFDISDDDDDDADVEFSAESVDKRIRRRKGQQGITLGQRPRLYRQ